MSCGPFGSVLRSAAYVEDFQTLFCRATSDNSPLEAGGRSSGSGSTRGWWWRCEGQPGGSGHTISGLGAISRSASQTLIVTTNNMAVHQWRSAWLDKTALHPEAIGEFTGISKALRPITITTYQMLTDLSTTCGKAAQSRGAQSAHTCWKIVRKLGSSPTCRKGWGYDISFLLPPQRQCALRAPGEQDLRRVQVQQNMSAVRVGTPS